MTWHCDREGCPTKIEVASGNRFFLPPGFVALERITGHYEFCSDFCLELFTHPKMMEQLRSMAVFPSA